MHARNRTWALGSDPAERCRQRILPVEGGDGSTLSLDFTTGVLDPRLTFTRSTSGTYIGADGLVKTATANTARFDHDPTAIGTPRGLLIEGSANNLTKYSEDLSQVSGINQWYGANMNTPTVPGGAPNSPYGTTAASWKLVATAGAAFHVWRNAVAFTAADYTFSFWAKAAEYDRIVLSDVGTGRGACSFVLTGNGTATAIAGTVTPTNPTIVKFDNGWYRCSVTMTMTAATYGMGIVGYPAATTPTAFGASYTADGTSGVYATMFQTELGSGASSYMPSGASQGSRAADFAVMSDIGSIGFNTAGGTLVMRGFQTKLASGSFPAIAAFLDATDSDVFGVRNDSAGATLFGRFVGSSTSAEAQRSLTNNTNYAFGFTADPTITTSAITVSMNGSSTTGNKTGVATAITTPTKFAITRPGYGAYINSGTIRSIKYWPTIKNVVELNALTT